MNEDRKMRIKEIWKKNRFESSCWLIYSTFSFVWFWLHEPWRDEAQAWLLARDLNLIELLKQIAWEGTPALWHLLIFPFANTGMPYISMFILHWIFAITAAWFWLFKAPFPKLFKFVFLFSYLMFFEYVLIARSYGVSVLLLFVLASMHQKRFKNPIVYSIFILLLFNTNIHSFSAAFAFMALFIWDAVKDRKLTKSNISALTIMVFGIGLLLLQMPSVKMLNDITILDHSPFSFEAIFIAIKNCFMPGFNLNILTGFFFSLVLLVFLFRFLQRPQVFIFLMFSVGGILLVFGGVYAGELRHHGLILIFLLIALWLEACYEKTKDQIFRKTNWLENITKVSTFVLILFLLFSVYQGIKTYRNELLYAYSGSSETAEYIEDNIPSDKLIIAYQSFACTSILPMIPQHKFWYADIQNFGSFLVWNDKLVENVYTLTLDEVINRAASHFGEQTKIFLLNSPIQNCNSYDLKLIFQNTKPIFSRSKETFYIYEEILE
jgi:hypothetical protein